MARITKRLVVVSNGLIGSDHEEGFKVDGSKKAWIHWIEKREDG